MPTPSFKDKKKRITASKFFQYVTCPSWVYWEVYGEEKDKKEISEFQKKIMEEGVLHEKKIIAQKDFVEVKFKNEEDAAFKTLELMKKGKNIYQGVLMDGDWTGRPDYLEAVPGKSRLGDHYYVPYDIKSSKKLQDVHKFQLTLYALLLERVQGVRPETGYVINAEGNVLSFSIEEFMGTFEAALEEIKKILAGAKPPPFLSGSCKQSPWFHFCKDEAKKSDDISLLYKITRKEWRKLKDAGIDTVAKMVKTDPRELKRQIPGMSQGRLEVLSRQAQALSSERAIVLEKPEFGSNSVEVYFDIEGDPLRDLEYLFGLLVVCNGEEKYYAFLAKKPEDEERAWKEFLDFVGSLGDAPIYHYGSYERQVINRLGAHYGISEEIKGLLDKNMVDLMRVCGKSVVFPIYFYSLKDIAKCLGFRWRNKDAGGMQSIIWYDKWISKKDKKSLDDVVEYNEDDVKATYYVKKWLEEAKPGITPQKCRAYDQV